MHLFLIQFKSYAFNLILFEVMHLNKIKMKWDVWVHENLERKPNVFPFLTNVSLFAINAFIFVVLISIKLLLTISNKLVNLHLPAIYSIRITKYIDLAISLELMKSLYNPKRCLNRVHLDFISSLNSLPL